MSWPPVIGEWETMRAVCGGRSIARFGDGEMKLIYGKGYVREPGSPELADELRSVLQSPHPDCLVGIPTMDSTGPKYLNWSRHLDRFRALLVPETVTYYSAFITRPDSAPWINCASFALLAETIWSGKRVAVICESRNKLLAAVRLSAKKAKHIRCRSKCAYETIAELERQALAFAPDVVLMSCGPTASCLANRFAARGVHAVDMGSAGGYLLAQLASK